MGLIYFFLATAFVAILIGIWGYLDSKRMMEHKSLHTTK
jgi:hypothetical protein